MVFHCFQLWNAITGVALINRVGWGNKAVHRNAEYLGKANTTRIEELQH